MGNTPPRSDPSVVVSHGEYDEINVSLAANAVVPYPEETIGGELEYVLEFIEADCTTQDMFKALEAIEIQIEESWKDLRYDSVERHLKSRELLICSVLNRLGTVRNRVEGARTVSAATDELCGLVMSDVNIVDDPEDDVDDSYTSSRASSIASLKCSTKIEARMACDPRFTQEVDGFVYDGDDATEAGVGPFQSTLHGNPRHGLVPEYDARKFSFFFDEEPHRLSRIVAYYAKQKGNDKLIGKFEKRMHLVESGSSPLVWNKALAEPIIAGKLSEFTQFRTWLGGLFEDSDMRILYGTTLFVGLFPDLSIPCAWDDFICLCSAGCKAASDYIHGLDNDPCAVFNIHDIESVQILKWHHWCDVLVRAFEGMKRIESDWNLRLIKQPD